MSDDRVATNYKMTRLVRTQTSEIYLIWDDDRRLGQLDLHFAHDTIHGTLILEQDLSQEQEEGLVAQIDVGSMLEQYVNNSLLAIFCSQTKGSPTYAVDAVRTSTSLE